MATSATLSSTGVAAAVWLLLVRGVLPALVSGEMRDRPAWSVSVSDPFCSPDPFFPPNPRPTCSSSCSSTGLMSLYEPGPRYIKSGWNQKPPPSPLASVADVTSSPCLPAGDFTLALSEVPLLLTCCWLTSFSSGGKSRGGAAASMNSGNSSPGFGKVYWMMPVGLYRKNLCVSVRRGFAMASCCQ